MEQVIPECVGIDPLGGCQAVHRQCQLPDSDINASSSFGDVTPLTKQVV